MTGRRQPQHRDVAIVGGGPAGAALAIRLAERGHDVVVFERLTSPRWRASGVYSSPLTRRRLLALGLPAADVERLIRPISAMVIRTADGDAACRLEYPSPGSACGIDRVRLEERLLARARQAGAEVREGAVVLAVELEGRQSRLVVDAGAGRQAYVASIVVGADGPSSLVARSAGVALAGRRFRRAALTVHHADPASAAPGIPMDAELIVGAGWYLGIAPVPGARVNLGLVLSERDLRHELALPGGTTGVLGRRLAVLPAHGRAWKSAAATDGIRVALPLAHRVSRAAGDGFLLVGDAAGFIDPLSGEGLQRAFAAAEMAADAVSDLARGDQSALSDYDRHLRARYRSKDFLSWFLQAFLFTPALTRRALRRLEQRPELRHTFAQALADLQPASRVLDPRFLAALAAV